MYNSAFKKIEYYLYNYDLIDWNLYILKKDIQNFDYNQNYNKWIKSQSSGLEEQAINNINIERKILKILRWKNLITEILEEYKRKDSSKYKFMYLKYFRRLKPLKIQDKLNISVKMQKEMKIEILDYIFATAIKNNMLGEARKYE